ncbi:MAG: hypothetical protein Q9176_002803 [Flavoplaca citrina]
MPSHIRPRTTSTASPAKFVNKDAFEGSAGDFVHRDYPNRFLQEQNGRLWQTPILRSHTDTATTARFEGSDDKPFIHRDFPESLLRLKNGRLWQTPFRRTPNQFTSVKKPVTKPPFEGSTSTSLPRDHRSSLVQPNSGSRTELPMLRSPNHSGSARKPRSRTLFAGTTPSFSSSGVSTPMQDLDQATQLKLVTLTFECSHQRYVSQLGNGPVRDHVDVASMMRSVPPAVKPLMADHRPKAKCSSCRNQNGAWHSGDKKVRFRAQNQYIDDDGSEYETADEGEDDEKKTLLKWGNERSGVQGLLI